jgi:uncharacterized membrane protein
MAKPITDLEIEEFVGNLLRTGVSISAFVVLIGACIYLAHHWNEPTHYRIFRGEPSDFRSIGAIIHSAFAGHGRGFIQLGLVLLIATPVARVAFSIWGFAAEHDRMYTTFTSIVLVILLYSLLGSGSAF